MLVTNIFSFSHNVFKCFLFQGHYTILLPYRGVAMFFQLVAKLSSKGAKLAVSENFLKKWYDFVHSWVFFSMNFGFFWRHFFSILFSDFIGVACYTNRKYWYGKCRLPVYTHAIMFLKLISQIVKSQDCLLKK